MKTLTPWKIANLVLGLMFAFAVVVQVNDPDPISWMALYGAAAVVCFLELRNGSRWWSPAIVGIIAVVWAATIAPRVIGSVPFAEMFGEFEMKNEGVEESREMYGLLIVAAWMFAVAARSGRSAQRLSDAA
jgi:hypothetical protein